MRLKSYFQVLTATLIASSLTFAAPGIAQTIELKASSFTSPQNPMTKGMVKWAELLKQKSNGRINITVFPASQMGPPPRQFDLARTGVADLTIVLHGLTPGRFPITELAHVPGVVKAKSNFGASEALTSLIPVFAAEHDGVKIINMFATKTLVLSRSEYKTASDLAGKRIRAAGSVQSDVLKAMGAAPALVQPTEMNEAFSRGMLDGISTAYSGIESWKLEEIGKFVVEGEMGLVTFATVMNQKAYDSLPADLKKIIDENSGHESNKIFARMMNDDENRFREALIKQGIKIQSLTDDEPLKKASGVILEDAIKKASAKGVDGKKVIQQIDAASAQFGGQM